MFIHFIAISTTTTTTTTRQVVLLVLIYVLLLKLVHLQFNSMAGAKDCLKKFWQFRLALELH